MAIRVRNVKPVELKPYEALQEFLEVCVNLMAILGLTFRRRTSVLLYKACIIFSQDLHILIL